LPLLESILPGNDEHLQRAVDLVLQTKKRKVAMLGLSFKTATDDLRESPQVPARKTPARRGLRNSNLGRPLSRWAA